MHDPFHDRLSAYLDGEIAPDDRSELEEHLTTCDRCRTDLAAMRDLVKSAGTLHDREPPRDLWPSIADRIGSPPGKAAPAKTPISAGAAAAIIVLAVGLGTVLGLFLGGTFGTSPEGAAAPVAGERFLLVLHEPPGMGLPTDPVKTRDIVARYRAWSVALASRGHIEAGEKLADGEGYLLRRDAAPSPHPASVETGEIGGFFLLRATDYEHAMRLIADCPHLELGGFVELRRIDT